MRASIRRLTLSALCAALGFVLLLVGALVEVMDLTAVFVASLGVVFIILEAGGFWPFLVWAATSVLSLLLLPGNKFCAVEYALFGGIYPIVKFYLEKLPRLPAALLKLLSFNLLFGGIVALSVFFFGLEDIVLPVVGPLSTGGYVAVLMILGNVVFVIYDYLITRLLLLYRFRWRAKLSRILK